MNEKWQKSVEKAIFELRRWPCKEVQIYHHNDSDGLSSGAVLQKAFEREGYKIRRFCLEKPYPKILQKIYEQEGCILIFADFAGRIAPVLSELNRERNLTLILDHHVARESTDRLVLNLDPDLFGLKGDLDLTASTTCYLFSCILNEENEDLAHIAAIGAVGDQFFVEGKLVSENRKLIDRAVRQGTMEIQPQSFGERYFLKNPQQIACDEIADCLDILGSVGYYQEGPEKGIRVCFEGISTKIQKTVKELLAIKEKAFSTQEQALRGGEFVNTPYIQWFHVHDQFVPMGVKSIGLFCQKIKDEDFLDSRKFLAGFQNIPNQVPGFGNVDFQEVKISMRVSEYLTEQIRSGKIMGLDVLLPKATSMVGGFSDACHSLTAATTIPIGKEEELIQAMNQILEES